MRTVGRNQSNGIIVRDIIVKISVYVYDTGTGIKRRNLTSPTERHVV